MNQNLGVIRNFLRRWGDEKFALRNYWNLECGFGGCNTNMGSRMSKMKRGFAVWGKKPLKLIRLDYKETKEYNYHCNFGKHFNHLTFEVINYSQRGCRLFGANLKKILQKIHLRKIVQSLKKQKNLFINPFIVKSILTK